MSGHGPTDCRAAVQALYDYLDEELTADRLEAMKQHLAHCTGCREHVEIARCFLSRLSSLPVEPTDVASLTARVRAALRREASGDLT